MEQILNSPQSGMKLGNHPSDLKKGEYALLVNGIIESITGDWLKISNEPSNFLCSKLNGYKLIGSYPVPSLSLTFVSLVEISSGSSEIGFIPDSSPIFTQDSELNCPDCNHPTVEPIPLEQTVQKELCSYTTLINADCLNFSIDHPVRMWAKVDDCNVRIYFTDGLNPFRYIDYPDFQKETLQNCPKIESEELDCDKIRVFKKTCYPKISYTDIVSGGENTAGVYQFGFAYADAYSNPLTSYFYITNPIDLFDRSKTILENQQVDYPISKSIKLHIEDINPDFDWFNLVVLRTSKGITTPHLIGTFSNIGSYFDYTFTGIEANLTKRVISIDEILANKPVYSKGNIEAESNGYLFFADVTEPRTVNLQPVFNKLPVYWQTVELNEGDYANPIIAEKYTGFLRDEVYALAIEPVSKTTKKYPRFHIPGRKSVLSDLEDVSKIYIDGVLKDNTDIFPDSLCDELTRNLKWEVYNTATNSGYACDYFVPGLPNSGAGELHCSRLLYRKGSSGGLFYPTPLLTPGTEIMLDHFCEECLQNLPNFPNISVISNTHGAPTLTGVTFGTCPGADCVKEVSIPCTIVYQWHQTLSDSSQVTVSYDCYSPVYYFWNDNYYKDEAHQIPINPLPCDCVSGTCDTGTPEVLALGGSSYLYTYNANVALPPIPNHPPSGILTTANNLTPCSAKKDVYNCQTPTLSQLPPNTSSTWYSAVASSTAIGVTITTPYILQSPPTTIITAKIYDTTGHTGFCTDIEASPLQTLTTLDNPVAPYFLFTGNNTLVGSLVAGRTYFIEVIAGAIDPIPTACPSVSGCTGTDFYYICANISPEVVSQETITLSDTYRTHCICTKTETVIDTPCNALTYEKGLMAYWESTETYPCNEEVWGDLVNQPIRHHKFPDCSITPHFKSKNTTSNLNTQYTLSNKIYPIGIVVKVEDVKNLLNEAVSTGLITEEEKQDICGYRILRSNRRGNESIIAKGIINDVWKYEESGKTNLYPNYPYNPRNPDYFNLTTKINSYEKADEANNNGAYTIKHPNESNNYVNDKYTFHSPNTHFNNPGLGNELKLELELYGASEGKYQKAKNHSVYQYPGTGVLQAALGFSATETFAESMALVAQFASTQPISVLGTSAGIGVYLILGLVSANLGAPGLIFNHYYEWLDLLTKFAPYNNFGNYYTSVGRYVNYNNVSLGNVRRLLNDAEYVNSGFRQVKDGANSITLNNIRRESSVYLNTKINTFNPTSVLDDSRWVPGDSNFSCDANFVYSPISSYYASLKNYLSNQYGQVYNIEYIDTGYDGSIDWSNDNQTTECDTIFGGDTFINRFSYRTQFPMFLQEAIGNAPNSDILYSQLNNVGNPRFFFNYPPTLDTADEGGGTSSQLYGNVAMKGTLKCDYNFACETEAGKSAYAFGLTSGILAAVAASITGVISIPITYGVLAGVASSMTRGVQYHPVYINGKMFLYFYGIPSPIVESNYNLDLRYGINQKEGDFYPNVGDLNQWTQPTTQFNLIDYDNTYFYNNDYSKQNKENLGFVLQPDFTQEKENCKSEHSNRLIYSLQDNDNNDRFDGNLVFLANNYHDFAKSGGKLSIVKGIENNKVLVIQENQASVFNSYVTLQTSLGATSVGSNTLFSQSPAQYIKTDLGYGGSQTQAIVATEFGEFWADNKRGQLFQLQAELTDITQGENSWWFKEHLPFKILQDFPSVDISNNYKWFGMAITFDSRLKRLIFTKRDAKLLSEYKNKVTFNGENFIYNNEVILPNDSKYFCNQSFTVVYNPLLKTFSSFTTYTPNYYLQNQNYFASGINFPTTDEELGVYNHLNSNQSYQTFYGKLNPFILEFSTENTLENTILTNITWKSDFRRFVNRYDNYVANVTYNKVLVFNPYQTSGNLELIKKQKNNLNQMISYPKTSNGYTQVLVENVENVFRLSQGLYDVSLQNGQPNLTYNCEPWQTLNPKAVSLKQQFVKNNLRNNFHQIRLINDKWSNYHITHQFSIQNETKSDI